MLINYLSFNFYYRYGTHSEWWIYRHHLGAYSQATQLKYTKAVHRFIQWWCIRYSSFDHLSRSNLDWYISEYILYLYTHGWGKAEAACVFSGFDMLIPGIKVDMHRSKRSLRGFMRLSPSQSKPPMPWPVCAVVALWLAFNGQYPMGLAVLVSFDGYLRRSEALKLRFEDIAVGADPRLGLTEEKSNCNDRVHIHIRVAKTGSYQGIEIRDPHVRELVKQYIKEIQPGQRLFPFSSSTYHRWFKNACSSLGLSDQYSPHCLRHGGATRDYLNNMPINDVMVRGRWAALKSASHYIQMGRQLMMLNQVPRHIDICGRTILTSLYHFMIGVRRISSAI